MTDPHPHDISFDEISAFIDGALPEDRCIAIEAACSTDPALAAQLEALAQDRARLAAAYAPIAQAPLPQAWLSRIESAVAAATLAAPSSATAYLAAPPLAATKLAVLTPATPVTVSAKPSAAGRLPPRWSMKSGFTTKRQAPWAIAACLAIFLAAAGLWQILMPRPDAILREAYAARSGITKPLILVANATATPDPTQRSLLRKATGLPVKVPDLRKLGWNLTALSTYRGAAQLSYANASGAVLTMYVRPSAGAPRFDLLRSGKLRVCVWQDDVVGAVIVGDMPAGQMMRVAGAAYSDLDM
jgi:anti-sigma factor RsiW